MNYGKVYHEKDISNISILVTGGAGFIGSNLVEYLLTYNVGKVRVLDNLSTGYMSNLEPFLGFNNFEFIKGDIRNLSDCLLACDGMDFVLHQAALGSVPRSLEDPITTNEVNVSGFLNMLVAVRDKKIKRMIYAASSSTYGDSKELPKVESRIGNPLSPYAVTKYVNELYANVFAKNYQIETIGLRYFNVFGPRQHPNGAYAAVIPLFVDAIVKNQPAVINGNGEQFRDFTFVENVVQANIKAVFLANYKNLETNVFNIAGGNSYTLNEIWKILNEINNTDIKPIYRGERTGDIFGSLANIDKAIEVLNYKPITNVKLVLEKLVYERINSK